MTPQTLSKYYMAGQKHRQNTKKGFDDYFMKKGTHSRQPEHVRSGEQEIFDPDAYWEKPEVVLPPTQKRMAKLINNGKNSRQKLRIKSTVEMSQYSGMDNNFLKSADTMSNIHRPE
jgi:hypothetical protein